MKKTEGFFHLVLIFKDISLFAFALLQNKIVLLREKNAHFYFKLIYEKEDLQPDVMQELLLVKDIYFYWIIRLTSQGQFLSLIDGLRLYLNHVWITTMFL